MYPWSSYINATSKLLDVLHHKCTQLLCTPADRVPNSSTGLETAGTRWIRHDRPNFERYPKACHLWVVLWDDFINLLLLLQTEFRSIQSIFLLPTTSLHLPLLYLAPDGGRKPNSSQKRPPRFCFGPPQSAQFMTSPQVRPYCHVHLLLCRSCHCRVKTNKFLNDSVRT